MLILKNLTLGTANSELASIISCQPGKKLSTMGTENLIYILSELKYCLKFIV